MMKRRLLTILLSCILVLTMMPGAAFAEDGGIDPVGSVEGSETSSEQSERERVQALIDALPGAGSISAENAEEVKTQLAAIDTAKAALSDEEQAALDMTRYEAAAAALAALENASMTLYIVLPDASNPESPETLTLEDVKEEDTISSIKAKIQSEKGYAASLQKLFATLSESRTELQDGKTLSDYGIQSGSTLTLELPAAKPEGTYDLADGSIEITVGETGAQTVKQGEHTTDRTGAVTLIQSGSEPTTTASISVTAAAGQTAHIVLAGVNINLNATGDVASSSSSWSFGTAAMATYGEGNVTLELDGTNALISGQFRAGLEKHNAGMLTINDENGVPGSLKAWGSYGGAGIGGIGCFYYFQDSHSDKFDQPYPGKMDDASVENITINGGTIEAESYANIRSYIESGGSRGDTRAGSGAGIGGGRGGTAKNITINGGTITTTAGSGAGIGGGSGGSLSRTSYIFYFGHAENITINGGTIHATSTSGAGIGGGYGISTASGDNFPKIGDRGNGKNITITGGKVTAISDSSFDSSLEYSGGAGIGGGSQGSGIGITITGGEVIAQGGNFSAGIGGGSQGSGIDITIDGGTVTATGGGGGAGIGSGGYQKNPDDIIPVGKTIHILGSSVHATGGSRQSTKTALNDKGGAGIGGGYGGNGIDIRIENAEVTAIGGKGEASDSYRKDGAGIGGGGLASSNNVAYGGTGENIFISNSTITATGTYGAGIGGGQGGNGVKISIVNGTVMKAKSVRGAGIGGGENGIGDDITITGSTVTAGSGGVETGGAGIGGGANGDGKNITITGSEVTAAGGLHGAGIGGGRNGNGESITISSGSRVTAYCGSGSPDWGNSAYGAGIGGGQAYDDEGKGKGNGRQITITDSEVLAFGSGGAGIGGGHVGVFHSASIPLDSKLGSGNGEDITIRGSKVTAYSSSGAGIGGGMTRGERYNTSRYSGMGRNITIEDSNVKAFSTCSGAGIGGGKGGDSENITIKSGTVTATGGYQGGAGIGGGGAYYGGNAKGITILGGTVTATGGSYIREGNREGYCYWGGAGIGGGGGECHGGGDAADITISGGTVTAIGGSNAAGIGGGSGSATDDANTRGEVFAYENPWNPSVRSGCAENITISGGTVTAIGQFKASGIGGGGFYAIIEDWRKYGEDPKNPIRAAGSAKNITITGGFITAQGGTEGVSIGRSAFSFFKLESSEEDLSASGGTFYRSIPNTVELQGHVVQYQVDGTVSAWQVVQDDSLAYLPRLTDENGVSLDEWYRENEKYDFDTPVIAGLTLTAQAHTCDGWRSDKNSHWHDCTDCGKILDKAAHVFGDWEAIAYPTKEATGKWERICTVCGYAETRILPALDDPKHSCVYDLKIVSPETQKTRGSCVQDKVYYMSCECGAISSTETFTVSGLPAHFMESGILPYNIKRSSFDVTQHWDVCASCHMIWERTKHMGSSSMQCADCDYRKSTHDHILKLIPAKAPTCTENGNIAYYICSGCSGTYKDEAGNEFIQLYGEYDALTKQTITEYGSGAIILATGHSPAGDAWTYGENAHWRLCTCGAVFDRALHTYGDWTVTKAPTTVRAGEKERSCTDCGYVQRAEVSPLTDPTHRCVYDQETVKDDALKSAATCTADAVYYKSCTCGAISSTETFTAEDTKLGHNWKQDWSKDSENHWKECSRCHEQNGKASHDFGESGICSTCQYDKSVPHTHTLTLVSAKAATCTETGNNTYYICGGCDDWFEDEACTEQITDKTGVLLPATGHRAVGQWKTGESRHWQTCTCGLVMNREEHNFGDWTVTKKATATQTGEKERSCEVCDYREAAEIPATGGSSGGGGAAIPSPSPANPDVVTVKDDRTGSETGDSDTTTKTTVKDEKTETTKNEQGQTVSKTTATVSRETAEELVRQATEHKSDTVEITVKAGTTAPSDGAGGDTAADSVKSTELTIPKTTLEEIAKNTDADLVIKTDSGEVTLDNKTLETIAKETKGDTVTITVNENTRLTEDQQPAKEILGKNGKLFDLAAKIGDKLIHHFDGGKAHVTLPMPDSLKGKDVLVIYINDKGLCEILSHAVETVGADSYIKFTTPHFSTFAVVDRAEAEDLIKAQNEARVKELMKNAKFKVTTTKTSKKSVKMTVTPKNNKELISDIKSMGYTVKYQFYRSTKKTSGYKLLKTKTTNSYTNTKGTKGRKYYYKARVLVYDGKTLIAKTALKQAGYGVRTWTK